MGKKKKLEKNEQFDVIIESGLVKTIDALEFDVDFLFEDPLYQIYRPNIYEIALYGVVRCDADLVFWRKEYEAHLWSVFGETVTFKTIKLKADNSVLAIQEKYWGDSLDLLDLTVGASLIALYRQPRINVFSWYYDFTDNIRR